MRVTVGKRAGGHKIPDAVLVTTISITNVDIMSAWSTLAVTACDVPLPCFASRKQLPYQKLKKLFRVGDKVRTRIVDEERKFRCALPTIRSHHAHARLRRANASLRSFVPVALSPALRHGAHISPVEFKKRSLEGIVEGPCFRKSNFISLALLHVRTRIR